jgi:hypothetical protein
MVPTTMLETLRQTFTDNWIAWAYQYGLGSLFFFATLWAGARAGTIDPRSRGGRRFLALLVGGLFLWAGFHAGWIARVHGPPGAVSQAELKDEGRGGRSLHPFPKGLRDSLGASFIPHPSERAE